MSSYNCKLYSQPVTTPLLKTANWEESDYSQYPRNGGKKKMKKRRNVRDFVVPCSAVIQHKHRRSSEICLCEKSAQRLATPQPSFIGGVREESNDSNNAEHLGSSSTREVALTAPCPGRSFAFYITAIFISTATFSAMIIPPLQKEDDDDALQSCVYMFLTSQSRWYKCLPASLKPTARSAHIQVVQRQRRGEQHILLLHSSTPVSSESPVSSSENSSSADKFSPVSIGSHCHKRNRGGVQEIRGRAAVSPPPPPPFLLHSVFWEKPDESLQSDNVNISLATGGKTKRGRVLLHYS
ncbi:hypothetical protein JOB18_005185 [Solea senegalensis]|uniref:Uncharacterized protein n=1 Tax=Solea senegalensis TaxID=28829 RepID=A0AAV6S2C3_SOLSE|nr:hypothetical protein JOB18_005185 [Solea senegalensis]